MKIHPIIATGIVAIVIGLQTWTLTKITALSEDVAVLKVKVSLAWSGYQSSARSQP